MADIADIRDLAVNGSVIELRVTPKAARNRLIRDGDTIRAYVSVVPEDGKANKAVIALLAKALGVPKSALVLVRGAKARDKAFRIDI